MSGAHGEATRRQLKLALEQAEARDRLRAASKVDDPDPEQVLDDIARLTDSVDDARCAINAARNVSRVKAERVAKANATTHLPDAAEWKRISAHFGLSETAQFTDRDRLQYARAFRGLRHA